MIHGWHRNSRHEISKSRLFFSTRIGPFCLDSAPPPKQPKQSVGGALVLGSERATRLSRSNLTRNIRVTRWVGGRYGSSLSYTGAALLYKVFQSPLLYLARPFLAEHTDVGFVDRT